MKPRVILVCGSHKRGDKEHVFRVLDSIVQYLDTDFAIVHGGANFIDNFADQWAKQNGYCSICVNANWNFFENKAGPVRNGWMLKFINIDLVVAFDGDNGTKDMIKKAKASGVTVYES